MASGSGGAETELRTPESRMVGKRKVIRKLCTIKLSHSRGSLQDAPAFEAVTKDNLNWDTALRSRPKFAGGCNRVLPRSPLLPSSPLFEQDFGSELRHP